MFEQDRTKDKKSWSKMDFKEIYNDFPVWPQILGQGYWISFTYKHSLCKVWAIQGQWDNICPKIFPKAAMTLTFDLKSLFKVIISPKGHCGWSLKQIGPKVDHIYRSSAMSFKFGLETWLTVKPFIKRHSV